MLEPEESKSISLLILKPLHVWLTGIYFVIVGLLSSAFFSAAGGPNALVLHRIFGLIAAACTMALMFSFILKFMLFKGITRFAVTSIWSALFGLPALLFLPYPVAILTASAMMVIFGAYRRLFATMMRLSKTEKILGALVWSIFFGWIMAAVTIAISCIFGKVADLKVAIILAGILLISRVLGRRYLVTRGIKEKESKLTIPVIFYSALVSGFGFGVVAILLFLELKYGWYGFGYGFVLALLGDTVPSAKKRAEVPEPLEP